MVDPEPQERLWLQSAEQWTRFLSALTHEMRTPLASLRMLADMLGESSQRHLTPSELRYTENIQEVVQDMQALVGEVSDLSRLLAGRVPVRSEDVVLETLIGQVEEAVRPQAWERGIALTESFDPALPRQVRTDPDHLRRLLTLVLGAAVGHAASEVFFRADPDDGLLRVAISSDGELFPEREPAAVLSPFHDTVRTSRRRGGCSLALPLADQLARALGGALRASNRGGRPTFDLSLTA